MLVELAVKNFAIIKDIRLSFSSGFNVITGETGAGKSIILEAIAMLYGKRANTSLIRTGEEHCYIEGIFSVKGLSNELLDYLREYGIEFDELLVVRRLIYRDKASRIYVNDVLVSLNFLANFGKNIISLLSQHESQKLFDSAVQLLLLDRFLGLDAKRKELSKIYEELQKKTAEYNKLQDDAIHMQREKDYLEYQIKEIEELSLERGEEAKLEDNVLKAKKSRKVLSLLNELKSFLNDGDRAVSVLALNFISNLLEFGDDEGFLSLREYLDNITISVDKALLKISELVGEYEFDSEHVAEMEYRLSEIRRLEKKFSCVGTDAILDEYQKMKKQLNDIENLNDNLEELARLRDDIKNKYYQLANILSADRKNNKSSFIDAVSSVLVKLGMPDIAFDIHFENIEPSITGLDRIYFNFSANRGEDLKPISKVASGGELSRVMLAIQSITNELFDYGIEVYDEIDTGIGGDLAFNVASVLRSIADKRQIIVITHLAQIARLADNHIFINKKLVGNRTEVFARVLSEDEKKQELNRMLGAKSLGDILGIGA